MISRSEISSVGETKFGWYLRPEMANACDSVKSCACAAVVVDETAMASLGSRHPLQRAHSKSIAERSPPSRVIENAPCGRAPRATCFKSAVRPRERALVVVRVIDLRRAMQSVVFEPVPAARLAV